MRRHIAALALPAALLVASPALAQQLAFPGAQGFGRYATGGRGGTVYHVTNLNDTGSGSLRACVNASGARTCVFRVGGTITLNSILQPTAGKLTIAGDTAPGGGIQLRLSPNHAKPLLRIQVPDVVVRNIRLRRGATSLSAAPSGTCCGDTISILSGADRVIFDRVSLAFSTDENADLYQARNVTIQNSIIAYGLRYSTDSDTVRDSGQHHSMGVLIGDGATNLSLINNLLALNLNRNPRIQSGLNEVCGNVVYGAQANPITISGGQANIIGNRFDRKPHNDWNYVVATSGSARVHQSGNVLPSGGTMLASGAATQGTPYATPSCAGKVPVALDKVGAMPRDALDQLTVGHVNAGTGGFADEPSDVGGWPTIANGTPYPDLDKDGLDDNWERANGLNPGNAADGAAIGPDGYSNLERFVTSIVTGQAPAPPPDEPEQPCN